MLNQDNASLSLSSTTGYQLGGESRPGYVLVGMRVRWGAGNSPCWSSRQRRLVKDFLWKLRLKHHGCAAPIPFAIAAVAGGSAFCVGYNFAWMGNMDASDTVSCSASTGLFYGNANADAGNQWGTGTSDGNSGNVGGCALWCDAGGGRMVGPAGADDAALD